MVKKFDYQGIDLTELEKMPMEKLFQLFPARARRSLTRGITDSKRKLIEEIKLAKAGKLKNPVRTHLRDLIILPYMVGVQVNVFSGKEFVAVNISPEMISHYLGEYVITNKHAREISVAIKGLSLKKARDYLQNVISMKRAVPFRRYKTQVGHKSDPGVMSGRYPQKSATEFLKLLDNLESNAEYKGMDLDRLKIINATVHKGVLIKRFIPRAMGRATPKNNVLTNVELVAQEA